MIEHPPDSGTRIRRQQRRSSVRPNREASEQLVLALADRVHGRPIVTTIRQMTVGELVREWREAVSPALRPSTI